MVDVLPGTTEEVQTRMVMETRPNGKSEEQAAPEPVTVRQRKAKSVDRTIKKYSRRI